MSPSTVPAAARPPPLPFPARARPAPPTYTRPLGLPLGGALGLRQLQRPARRRLHFPSFVSALEAGSWPDRSPCHGPPSALRPSRGGWPQPRSNLRGSASAPASLKSSDQSCRRARSRASVQYGYRALANASRAAHPPARPVPGTYLAALRSFSATRWSLPVRASPPLVSVSTEWRRRRCCGCEQRDPRAAESSLCKAG